jgi:hypothetical protein
MTLHLSVYVSSDGPRQVCVLHLTCCTDRAHTLFTSPGLLRSRIGAVFDGLGGSL